MKKTTLLLALTLALSSVFAAGADYPPISMIPPSSGKAPVDKSQFLLLVIEPGLVVSHEGVPIRTDGVISYVNGALKAKGASLLGVHIRQGIKYGEVVRILDDLRKTDAKSIGVSMVEIAPGKEP
jgi:biopolymer transport protein ExbD